VGAGSDLSKTSVKLFQGEKYVQYDWDLQKILSPTDLQAFLRIYRPE
jgi:hypothetical protein